MLPLAVQDGAARGALPLYRGTVDAVRVMIQQEGWRSLYGGLSPALLGAGMFAVAGCALSPCSISLRISAMSYLDNAVCWTCKAPDIPPLAFEIARMYTAISLI